MAVSETVNPGTKWKRYASITVDTVLPWATRGIYIGGAGDVSAFEPGNESGTAEIFSGVPAGVILPILTTKLAAATSATDITIIG